MTVLAPSSSESLGSTGSVHDRARTEAGRIQQVVGAAGPLVVASVCEGLDVAAAAAPAIWQSAQLALGLGIAEGAMDSITLAPYAALFDGDGVRLGTFIDSMLGPVREWDRAHGSELLQTLGALFDERWSLTATARVLHIHVNTMKQRMQRLNVLLGEELDRPESRFRLELALRIENARSALKST